MVGGHQTAQGGQSLHVLPATPAKDTESLGKIRGVCLSQLTTNYYYAFRTVQSGNCCRDILQATCAGSNAIKQTAVTSVSPLLLICVRVWLPSFPFMIRK